MTVRPLHRSIRAVLLAVLGTALLAGFPVPSDAPVAAASRVTPGEVLALLTVTEESSSGTYRRAAFRHWVDADADCQDTRVEVLIRENLATSPEGCRLYAGRWLSWLDGRTVTSSRSLDVDHLVALAEAWRSGASTWSSSRREAFANDLGYEWSLRAVSASVNRSKSDKDPARWLPASAYRCDYLTRWMLVKYRWGLSVDGRERSVLASATSGACGERLFELPVKAPSDEHPDDRSPTTVAVPPVTPRVTSPGPVVPDAAPVTPGAFCSPPGATGRSSRGVDYVCRSSATDVRNRWRR